MIRLLSVRHSGTRWLTEALMAMGETVMAAHTFEAPDGFEDSRPLVIPVRDPVLSVISGLNRGEQPRLGMAISDYERIARLYGLPDVHFVRVHPAVIRNDTAVVAHRLGLDAERVSYAPVGDHKDVTGLRAAYHHTGHVPGQAVGLVSELASSEVVMKMLNGLMGEMPWLRAA